MSQFGAQAERNGGKGATSGRGLSYMLYSDGEPAPRTNRTTHETMNITSASAIRVRFLGPTDYKGARVKLSDTRGLIERPLTIGYGYAEQGAIRTAFAFLRENGWDTEGARTVELGRDTLIVLRDWTSRDHWKSGETQ